MKTVKMWENEQKKKFGTTSSFFSGFSISFIYQSNKSRTTLSFFDLKHFHLNFSYDVWSKRRETNWISNHTQIHTTNTCPILVSHSYQSNKFGTTSSLFHLKHFHLNFCYVVLSKIRETNCISIQTQIHTTNTCPILVSHSYQSNKFGTSYLILFWLRIFSFKFLLCCLIKKLERRIVFPYIHKYIPQIYFQF